MELEVLVPADAVKAEVEKAYSTLSKKAHVRGFRPGKAPRQVLKQLFGPQVHSDVMNSLVQGTLPKALSEKNVTPVSQPAVEAPTFEPTADFSYKARFEVQPEIEEVKFDGFQLIRPPTAVEDTQLEEQLEQIRQRSGTLKDLDPARPAQSGDVATIDFTLSVDGEPVKDGGGQGLQVQLGSGQLLPELDAALVGKSIGDTFDVEAAFPDAHPSPQLKGKKGKFAVTVQGVKERVLPGMDDELAKAVGFETLVALRADMHTKLEKALKDRAETTLAEQIVHKLNELNPLDVPPTLVEQQCQMMEAEIAMTARRVGQPITQQQLKAMHGRIHVDAEKKVRAGLLMAAIAKKHEFKVTDEDLEKGLQELAAETGKNVAKLRVEYRDANKRNMLIGMILEDKILDFIESKSTIADGTAEAAAAATTGTASSDAPAPAASEEKKSDEETK